MDQFPGNSRRQIEEEKTTPPIEEVKLEPIVAGKVIKRKKPLGRRMLDTFFSGDSDSVIGYLGKQVLLPALQNLVTDFVTQGIEKAVYGDVQTPRRTAARGMTSTPRPHISYNQPSSIVRSPATTPGPRRPVSQPSAFEMGEFVVDSKMFAEMVAEKLFETLEEYGAVTVANLKELLSESSDYTDHKWGWTDLERLKISRVREGYLLQLPTPEDLR